MVSHCRESVVTPRVPIYANLQTGSLLNCFLELAQEHYWVATSDASIHHAGQANVWTRQESVERIEEAVHSFYEISRSK